MSIKVLIYGEIKRFETKEKAINFFKNCQANSEGAEQERYTNILIDLESIDKEYYYDYEDEFNLFLDNLLELKFDYENTSHCRTHYTTKYKGKKYNIVILHQNDFDEICTATKDGEPNVPVKDKFYVTIDKKLYKIVNDNGYSKLKEV